MRRLALAFSFLSLAACTFAPDDAPAEGDAEHPTEGASANGGSGRGASGGVDTSRGGTLQEDSTEVPEATASTLADSVAELPLLEVKPQDWMSRTPTIWKKPLNKIFIPGTHDSGTYGIQSVYSRPVDDAFAPDGDNKVVRLGQFIGVSDKWAKAQEKNLTEQLGDGIRALDLRPCREKSGTLRICHSLYGPTMSDLLTQVSDFVNAHPKEIVIIGNQGFAGMGAADHQNLLALYQTKLGSHILDYNAPGVSPASTPEELWTNHPGKNVIIMYADAARPANFWPSDSVTGSWKETWDRAAKKTSLEVALPTATATTFFSFSGAATPDEAGKLITNSMDPLGTYPHSLAEMADDTNPVMLGWLQNEWAGTAANMVYLDFYNRTCLYGLTQRLNGNLAFSLDGCSIGTKTAWGNWRLGYERFGYGRGAGTPLTCDAATQEKRAGLCYPKCRAGYESPVLFPTVCAMPCPAGYRDDGLTCFRDAKIISANNSKCPWYDKCGLTVKKGCSTCPSGFRNDGCTCRQDPNSIVKTRYDRGVGRVPDTCISGEEKSGLLCYPTCPSNFHGVGPMCMPND